jgi:hypothetical protein
MRRRRSVHREQDTQLLDLGKTCSTLCAAHGGTLDDKAAFGTVVVDGAEWPFSARGVAAPAGLYEGRGSLRGVAARVGWIVEDDGTVTGVLTAGGESSRAPALDPDAPAAATLEGRPVAVTAIAGDATVVRR